MLSELPFPGKVDVKARPGTGDASPGVGCRFWPSALPRLCKRRALCQGVLVLAVWDFMGVRETSSVQCLLRCRSPDCRGGSLQGDILLAAHVQGDGFPPSACQRWVSSKVNCHNMIYAPTQCFAFGA